MHGDDIRREAHRIHGRDIGVGLLAALSTLPAAEREAWVDFHVVGLTVGSRRMLVSKANLRLREHFQSPERLYEEAA